jgi:hypothetical protein
MVLLVFLLVVLLLVNLLLIPPIIKLYVIVSVPGLGRIVLIVKLVVVKMGSKKLLPILLCIPLEGFLLVAIEWKVVSGIRSQFVSWVVV